MTDVETAALWASEIAKRLSDDAYTADDHRAAAKAHRAAAQRHAVDVAWLHERAEIQHRQAAKARAAVQKIDAQRALQKSKTWAVFQEELAAVGDHQHMAQEYARQALAAAKKRGA